MGSVVDSRTDGHGGGSKAASGEGNASVGSRNGSSNGASINSERRGLCGGGNALHRVFLPSNGAVASVHSTAHGSSAGSRDGGINGSSSNRERRGEADSNSNGRSTVGDIGGVNRRGDSGPCSQ